MRWTVEGSSLYSTACQPTGASVEDIRFNCPHCQQHLEAPADMAEEPIACPACDRQIEIPAAEPVPDSGLARHTGIAGVLQKPDKAPAAEAPVLEQFMAGRDRKRRGNDVAFLLRRLCSLIICCVAIAGVIAGVLFGYRAVVSWRKQASITGDGYHQEANLGKFHAMVTMDFNFDGTYCRRYYWEVGPVSPSMNTAKDSTVGTYSMDDNLVKCSDGCVYKRQGDTLLLVRVEKTDQNPGVVGVIVRSVGVAGSDPSDIGPNCIIRVVKDGQGMALERLTPVAPCDLSEPLVFMAW